MGQVEGKISEPKELYHEKTLKTKQNNNREVQCLQKHILNTDLNGLLRN